MRRIKSFITALIVSVSSLGVLITPHAFAATKTWDGGGSDNNMLTAANWNADSVPTAGDDLVFPANVAADARDIVNDFTAATSFNSITFSGTASADSNYDISGNSMTLVAGVTHTMTGSFNLTQTLTLPLILNGTQTFNAGVGAIVVAGTINLGSSALTFNTGAGYSSIDGVVSGTGTITKSGAGYLTLTGNNLYSGATTVSAGELVVGHVNGLGTAAAGTTVSSGAALYFYQGSGDVTYTEPLTLGGTGLSSFEPTVTLTNGFNQGGLVQPPYATATLSGAITLTSDIKVGPSYRNGKITGAITGSHAIALADSAVGSLEIASSANGSSTANSTLTPAAKETKYEDDQASSSVTVNMNETAIVTGVRGDISINPSGVLKGTGTVGDVLVAGKLAPGLSPGCLNSGDLTFLTGSTYEFEVGGTTVCTEYDQTKVTGTVALDGTLSVLLYNSFKPTAGQKYVIISNDGTDAVTGTFSGLAQGATVTSGGYSFSISYTGGDGNDVELTSLGTAPNTGFALIQSNPIVTMLVMLAAAVGVVLVARRSKLATRRR